MSRPAPVPRTNELDRQALWHAKRTLNLVMHLSHHEHTYLDMVRAWRN